MVAHMSRSQGFSLIELLVVIAIILITTAGGFVTYRTFTQRQELVESGKQVYQALRAAQTKAQAGDKPSSCGASDTLRAFGVIGSSSATQVQIQVHCGSTSAVTGTYQFNGNVVLSSGFDVRFLTLYGGINSASPVVITLTHALSGDQYQLTVSPGGAVADDGIQ